MLFYLRKKGRATAGTLYSLHASCLAVFWTALHSSLQHEPDLDSLKQHKGDLSPSVILSSGTWPL